MYKVKIPEELRPKIIEYINNAGKSMKWNQKQLIWLLTIYYRYVEQLGRFKTVEEKVKTKMRCGDCRETMLDYFEQKIDEWQGKAW